MKTIRIICSWLLMMLMVCACSAAVLLIRQYFMLEGVIVFGCCCVAAFWGWVLHWLYNADKLTVSHIIGIWMVVSGTLMGAASYYLSYKGIQANLETLSRYALVEVVSGAGGYFLKSGVENVLMKRHKSVRDL